MRGFVAFEEETAWKTFRVWLNEKERLERQIKSTDGGGDKLVYELYGLSEEEIRIVEGNV